MLIDLATAKRTLRVLGNHDDLEIQQAADRASAIVIDYIKRPDHGWTAQTVPLHIQAAICIVLKRLYDDRAGELEGGFLSQAVRDLLWRERDPAMA